MIILFMANQIGKVYTNYERLEHEKDNDIRI